MAVEPVDGQSRHPPSSQIIVSPGTLGGPIGKVADGNPIRIHRSDSVQDRAPQVTCPRLAPKHTHGNLAHRCVQTCPGVLLSVTTWRLRSQSWRGPWPARLLCGRASLPYQQQPGPTNTSPEHDRYNGDETRRGNGIGDTPRRMLPASPQSQSALLSYPRTPWRTCNAVSKARTRPASDQRPSAVNHAAPASLHQKCATGARFPTGRGNEGSVSGAAGSTTRKRSAKGERPISSKGRSSCSIFVM